jgi:hypothetical protein
MNLTTLLTAAPSPVWLWTTDSVGIEVMERHDVWCLPCYEVWRDDPGLATYTLREITRAEANAGPLEGLRCIKCDDPLVCVVRRANGTSGKVECSSYWRGCCFDPRDDGAIFYISEEGIGYTGRDFYRAVERSYGGIDDVWVLSMRARKLFYSSALLGQPPATLIGEEQWDGCLFGWFDEYLLAPVIPSLPGRVVAGKRTYRSALCVRLDANQAGAFDVMHRRQVGGGGAYFSGGKSPLVGTCLLVDVRQFCPDVWEWDGNPPPDELAAWLLAQGSPLPGASLALTVEEAAAGKVYAAVAGAFAAAGCDVCAWRDRVLIAPVVAPRG